MVLSSLSDYEVETAAQQPRAKYLRETEILGDELIGEIQGDTAKKVHELGKNTRMYMVDERRAEPDSALPFRVATEPFALPEQIKNNLDAYGQAIVAYYNACDELYSSLPKDHRWKKYLEHSKPSFILDMATRSEGQKHLFLRPDFVLHQDTVTTTEIETSPFGLALADFLNRSYRESGKETGIEIDLLLETFVTKTGLKENPELTLCFVITDHTQKYLGQFEYLVEKFQHKGYKACVSRSQELAVENGRYSKDGQAIDVVYRGFYLHESVEDENLRALLDSGIQIYPPVKPHLEEKALMGMFFDSEFEEFFKIKLGPNLKILQEIFPKTWVVGDKNMPDGIHEWLDLANLPASKRKYVFKLSGFDVNSSWGKGVKFLHKLSKEKCRAMLEDGIKSETKYVVQEFRKGDDFEQEYFDFQNDRSEKMKGKVRLTPYFDTENASMLTAKTTLCENTDYIHGMVDAINSPIL